MGDPNLVTTCAFHGQEFLFKMNVLNSNLEILVTDKNSGEEWQCSYDATYVENLTQKTGNFKQFDIFVAMLKSGLLRTSECVSLDLLTFEDLELLRSRKITKSVGPANNNRRYLILTYVVEFDKIRYPLPLEYCGPPDPVILQATIRRLEVELAKTKEDLAFRNNNTEARKVYFLQKRVDELTEENAELHEEIRQLTKCLEKKPKAQVFSLQKAVSNLEKSVILERNSHHELVEKLREDKVELAKQLEKVKCSERSLKTKLNKALSPASRSKRSSKQIPSRSSSNSSANRYLDPEAEYGGTSRQESPALTPKLSRTKNLLLKSRCSSGDHCKKPTTHKLSTQSIRTMFKRSESPVFPESTTIRVGSSREDLLRTRSKSFWNKARSKRSSKQIPSRSSSNSSANRYLDPEAEYGGTSRQESPALTPKLSRTKNLLLKSRCSSGNSSGASSRASSRRSKGQKHLDYKKLEDKIENLQKMLKSNMVHDK